MARIAEVALFTREVAALTAFYERVGAPDADHVAIALDQDAAADRARAGGADVVGPKESYWGRSAYVRDPDGRVIELQSD